MIRVIIPDSHGSHIDVGARDAFLGDLKRLDVGEVVLLGDHVDCGGIYNAHGVGSKEDRENSYFEDIEACNSFLDSVQKLCPKASFHYLCGNHEFRVTRWAAKNMTCDRDIEPFLKINAPEGMLKLKERGIRFYAYDQCYHGLSIPNTIKLGKCFFTHGVTHAKHAASSHLELFGASVVFGHVHRSLYQVTRTIKSEAIMAACPGTLAKLQPVYFHSRPSGHVHGYAFQEVSRRGLFFHHQVPIVNGKSMLGIGKERIK